MIFYCTSHCSDFSAGDLKFEIMSVLSSKLIAINIVDVADGSLLASDITGPRQDKDGHYVYLKIK